MPHTIAVSLPYPLEPETYGFLAAWLTGHKEMGPFWKLFGERTVHGGVPTIAHFAGEAN